jgi:hypothetical protein
MGYGWGCKLAVVSLVDSENKNDKDIEVYMKKMATTYKNFDYLPDIGEKLHGSSSKYSCGGLDNIKEFVVELLKFANEFPDTVFALHHFYWDFSLLTIYTFSKDGISHKDTMNLENLMVGKHKISSSFDFDGTTCNNDISMFFTSDYRYEFEWN